MDTDYSLDPYEPIRISWHVSRRVLLLFLTWKHLQKTNRWSLKIHPTVKRRNIHPNHPILGVLSR